MRAVTIGVLLVICPVRALGAEAPRLKVWGTWGAEIYQSAVTLPVRIHTDSFIANGQGANLDSWRFAVQYAIQRWNEFAGAGPLLVWDSANGTQSMQCGVINIKMDGVPDACNVANGVAARVQYLPYQQCMNNGTGETSGGLLTIRAGVESTCVPNGAIQWSFTNDGSGFPGGPVVRGLAPYMIMHELGHIFGLGHSGACAGEATLMADGNCSSGLWSRLHGPLDGDIRAARKANGSQLTRLSGMDDHFVSYGASDGASWGWQGDDFQFPLAMSAVAVGANGTQATNGRFAIAFRGNDNADLMTTMTGYSNDWDHSTAFTWASPRAASRGQPSIASTTWGDFLVAFTDVELGNPTNSDSRQSKAVLLDDYNGRWGPFSLPTGAASAEPPAVAFVRPNSSSTGFWVLGTMDRTAPAINIRTAPWTANKTLSWSAPVTLQLPSSATQVLENLRPLAGFSLACKTVPFGTDDGRCIVTYASDGSRTDEINFKQTGFLRTAAFRVLTNGTLFGQFMGANGLAVQASTFGFSSGNKTFGSTTATFNRRTGTWHMAWAHNDSPCYWWMRAPGGGNAWPSPSCPISYGSNATASPAIHHSDYWDALLYYVTK